MLKKCKGTTIIIHLIMREKERERERDIKGLELFLT